MFQDQSDTRHRRRAPRLFSLGVASVVFATGMVSPAIAAPGDITDITPNQLTAAGTTTNATNLRISGPIKDGSTTDISFPSTDAWKDHLDLDPSKSWQRVTYVGQSFQSQGISGYVGFPEEEAPPAFVGNAAFEGNAITQLDLGGVTTVQFRGFANNRITTINAPNLVTVGNFSFNNNPISTLNAPVLEDVGDHAFQASRFTSLSLPAATKIGAGAFFGSTITELIAPKIAAIGDKAFAGSSLLSLTLDELPKLEGQPFINSAGASQYDGLFPLYIKGHENNSVFPFHGVIVNPDENWRNVVGFTPPDDATFLTLHPKGQPNTGFVTALDGDGNEYFCVGEHIHFRSGYFVGTAMSGIVYVIQHGMNEDPAAGIKAAENIVAIGEAPADGNWIYGYEADLVSKLAFHADALLTEFNIEDRRGSSKLINLPTSDLNIREQIVLTHENFGDYARNNASYDGLVEAFGSEFMTELLARVTADKRTYTPATYYDYVGNAADVNEFGQPVVKPGQPVVNPGTPQTAISWQKVSSEDDTTFLAGSEWQLTLTNGEDAGKVFEITDCVAQTAAECLGPDEDATGGFDRDPREGHFHVSGLEEGSYVLVETKAPNGFVLDETPIEIEVRGDLEGTVAVGNIVNAPIEEIPSEPTTPEPEDPTTPPASPSEPTTPEPDARPVSPEGDDGDELASTGTNTPVGRLLLVATLLVAAGAGVAITSSRKRATSV